MEPPKWILGADTVAHLNASRRRNTSNFTGRRQEMTGTDDQHTINSSVFDENRSFLFMISRRLYELQKSYELHGLLTSLHDAIELIRESGAPTTPEWILDGALKVICERLAKPMPVQKGGPSGNENSKLQNDLRHFRRWLMVRKILKSNLPKKISVKKACEKSSKLLQSYGELSVAPDTVEKSYYKIEMGKKDPKRMWKYQPPRRIAAKLTGTLPGSDTSKG
jgi:hypothetical protein